MIKYICVTDCFQKIVDKHKRYNQGEIYEFPEDVEVPHHFEPVSMPIEMLKSSKALKMFEEELELWRKVKNPYKDQVDRMKELESKIALIKKSAKKETESDTKEKTEAKVEKVRSEKDAEKGPGARTGRRTIGTEKDAAKDADQNPK
jgi:hypothetical protein